ncbi:MAG: hypothetical protein ACRDOD_01240 [Streptosporangiaceae bacterium]
MTTGARGMDESWHPQIQLLDLVALEELKGKVQNVAAQPGAADRVREWRAKYGKERATPAARSFVVVGQTLMFLRTCPDGVVLPFAAYPDGTVKVYTDVNHARESFYTDAQAPPAPGLRSAGRADTRAP